MNFQQGSSAETPENTEPVRQETCQTPVVTYSRVSSSRQKEDLGRQQNILQSFVNEEG
ncbi:MAG: hypothetical protein ACXAC7_07710 [Candidatus Hodarchaeales archaeon]|jgi:predicted site-specific integrase-resolvase